VIGIDAKKISSMGWRIFGKWPEGNDEILAGINLKAALRLQEGQRIFVKKTGQRKSW